MGLINMASAIQQPQGMGNTLSQIMGIQQSREMSKYRAAQDQRAQATHDRQGEAHTAAMQAHRDAADKAGQAKLHGQIGKMISWADTPEKWAQGITYLQGQGHEGITQFADAFESRDMLGALYGMKPEDAAKAESAVGKITADIRAGRISPEIGQAAINKTLGIGEGGSWRTLSPEDVAAQGLPAGKTYQQGPDGKIAAIGGGGQTINVGGQLAKPPTGYAYKAGPDGLPIKGENGAPILVPMEGGEAATKIEQMEEKAAGRSENAAENADLVLDSVDRLRDMLDKDHWLNPAVGFGSGIGEQVRGSNANNFKEVAATIEANIAFGALQEMRANSPTGGALGAVSERELALLKSTVASLSAAQSENQVRTQLGIVEDVYSKIMEKAAAYPNAEQYGFRKRADRPSADVTADDESWIKQQLGGN